MILDKVGRSRNTGKKRTQRKDHTDPSRLSSITLVLPLWMFESEILIHVTV